MWVRECDAAKRRFDLVVASVCDLDNTSAKLDQTAACTQTRTQAATETKAN